MADPGGFDLSGLSGKQAENADKVRQKMEMDALKARLAGAAGDEKALKKACQDFEAIFIGQLWKQMRETLPKEGYLHSKEEDFYMGMFDHELAKKMSSAGGIGLGDMLYQQLVERLPGQSGREPGDPLTPAPGLGRGVPEKERQLTPYGEKDLKPLEESLRERPMARAPGPAEKAAQALGGGQGAKARVNKEAHAPEQPRHLDPSRLGEEEVRRLVDRLAEEVAARAEDNARIRRLASRAYGRHNDT
jgi:flagellar protein FlgJ